MSLNQIRWGLTSRLEDPPHKQWSEQAQAAIVILWGLLIYPQLDKDIKKQWNAKDYIELSKFHDLFQAYSGDQTTETLLELLTEYDYVRLDEKNHIRSGTQLFSAVHALGMYRFFRSSVIARQLFQTMQKTSSSS
ncbi:hypothetical protein MK805_01315 [Shimazuella sp. AN120528]|uniref:hypothetical protein n=1 Tax=Shimazuella soli TaxID=1892854 RepID=UPI001F0FA72A|nr:hypothetical protein [Shimazuella soli]MCH5583610.1 hypothetical protein [Shimazuella soli]